MTKLYLALAAVAAMFVAPVVAQQPAPASDAKAEPTKASFLVTGLHCPACTPVVESSLRGAKGIRAVKVDWKTKAAQIEFDETIIPVQRVAQLIAATPHMMGGVGSPGTELEFAL